MPQRETEPPPRHSTARVSSPSLLLALVPIAQCGDSNSFFTWFGSHSEGSGEASSGSGEEGHELGDIVAVIHDYLISLSATLENAEPELRNISSPCSSPAPPSCPCSTCADDTETAAFWTNSSWTLATMPPSAPLIAFDFTTVSLTARGDAGSTDGILETCMSSFLDNAFLKVAAREADIYNRIGYEYAAFQALGNYVQWPAIEWCTDDYDPRFRSWYVSAASGPKDVVIVLDNSGSMSNSGRMQIAIDAAVKLLDTLTDADYVGVIKFASTATALLGNRQLVQATDAARAELKTAVEALRPDSSTNFVGAFNLAFQMLSRSASSEATSGCTKAILFLSDGEPDSWDQSNFDELARKSEGVQVFTYALGDGAQQDVLKSIACRNNGAMWAVPDNANLGDAMADYYTFLAPLQEPCQVRWTYYTDYSSGVPLLAACLATFKKPQASSDTWCAAGSAGCMPELMGVMCMDASVIVSKATIDARADSASFYDRVTADQTACNKVAATAAQLQGLRRRISTTWGDAVCTAGDMGTSTVEQPVSCYSNMSTVAVDEITGWGIFGIVFGFVTVILCVVLICCLRHKKAARRPRPTDARSMATGASQQQQQPVLPVAQGVAVAQPVGYASPGMQPAYPMQTQMQQYPTQPAQQALVMGQAIA